MFLSRTQMILAFAALLLVAFVLDLVRRRRLSEEYSLLWVVSTLGIAVLGFSTPLLRWITHLIGALFESSTVFAAGLAFTTTMLLYLSVKMSRLTQENQILARELALLEAELEERAPRASQGS